MIQLLVNFTECRVLQKPKITSGAVGLPCEFVFSEEWENLHKTAVFVGSGIVRDVIFEGNTVIVPHETLSTDGTILQVGVYGTDDDGKLVIPTVYAIVGMIVKGADPSGDEGAEPTPELWEQVLRAATQNQPKIGENGNWWTWNGKEYVDSGFSASGDDNTTESTSLKLTDTMTGTVYDVTITNGKLTLTEVE